MTEEPDLESAYALETPEDNKRLYRKWAKTYDSGFADEQGYALARKVAQQFVAAGGTGPTLDMGAGTGLCGAALAGAGIDDIDATDISEEMLEVAAGKGVYRRVFYGDLTHRLPVADGAYGGLVSSGTFTHGHVGPDALDEVLRCAASGALIVLSINAEHFSAKGFDAKFTTLSDQISDPKLPEVRIYAEGAEGPHANDRAFLATFRKL